MNVVLLTKTQNALKAAFTAIRTCYSPKQSDEIWNKEFDEYVKNDSDHIRLIKQIVNHGHTSTLEHISFTFSVEGVSRSLLAQLTRHRIGFSYSVQSQRYVNASRNEFSYVTPPEIEELYRFTTDNEFEHLSDIYHETMEQLQGVYNTLIERGIKPEDARYVLPNAATTTIILTFNLRAFMDFYSKRNSTTHAQWEIADLAEELRDILVLSEPWLENLL